VGAPLPGASQGKGHFANRRVDSVKNGCSFSANNKWVRQASQLRSQIIVDDALQNLKAELARFGQVNDATQTERPHRMLNITRDTGEFLAVLVRATAAQRVLEIGTSNGYSTLWLAEAAKGIGGSVTTVEFAEYKARLAAANFARSGLSPFVTLVRDDARHVLERSGPNAYDLIFLDAERPEYPGWWPELRRVLRPGGLLIVDNASTHVEQMAPFVALVTADIEFATCLVPVGNGAFLAVKNASPDGCPTIAWRT